MLTQSAKVGPDGLVLPTGHALLGGTILGVNPWPIHRNTDIFGPDADEFRPERWLRGDNEAQKSLSKHTALLELYKLICTLFGLFEVGHHLWVPRRVEFCHLHFSLQVNFAEPHRPEKVHALLSVKSADLLVTFRDRHESREKSS